MPDDEREFAWLTPTSRWGCVSATAIRIYLHNKKAEQALEESLHRYSKNGDLIGRFEREGVLIDALMLSKEAWKDSHYYANKRSRAKRKAM